MSEPSEARVPGFVGSDSFPLRPLRHSQFRLFFVGAVLANVATWMQQFVIGWLVVQLAVDDGHPERGAFYLGLLGLARLAPLVTLGLVAGVAADRFDRVRLLLATRAALTLLSAALTALILTGRINIVLVMVLTALLGSAFAFDGPARLSLTQTLVGPREAVGAIGMVRVTQQTSGILGPLFGGLLIAPIGVVGVMGLITLLYVLSGLGLSRLESSPATQPAAAAPPAPSSSPLDAFGEGLRYVRREPTLRSFMSAMVPMCALAGPFVFLLPAVAHDSLRAGAVELSWLAAASGLGAVLGAAVVMTMGTWSRPGRALLVDAFALGCLLVLFGFQRTLGPALLLAAAIGCTSIVYLGGVGTIIQLTPPSHIRGRVLGVHVTLANSSMQLGTLVLGTAGSFTGVSNTLGGAGVLIVVAVLVMLRVPTLLNAGDRTGARLER